MVVVQDGRNHPIDNRMMDTKVFDIDDRSYRNLEVLEHDNIRSFCSRRGNVDSVEKKTVWVNDEDDKKNDQDQIKKMTIRKIR